MVSESPPAIPTPARILQVVAGYQPLYALAGALDLRLFTRIAEGMTSEPMLEIATGASQRGLGRLLNVMVSLGFLKRIDNGTRYQLTPETEAFLVEGRPSYLGGHIRFSAYRLSEQWQKLTECIRTGEPAVKLDKPEVGAMFWDEAVDLLFPWNYPLAMHAAQELHRIHPTGVLRLLDVAAGSGVWGIAAAQINPTSRVLAFDLPHVLEHASRNAVQFGLAERFEFRAGDIRRDTLGEAEFDAAILGHICHSEGAEHSRLLLAKVAHALKHGGTIIIADILPNEDRSGPLFALMYSLSMLVSTTEGDTFTFAEYYWWLKETGFRDIRLLEAIGQKLVLATRS